MASKCILIAAIVFCGLALAACIPRVPPAATPVHPDSKQLFGGAQGKETTTSDFIRLVVMRLVYGIASTMGLEERLADMFNGAFVPPGEEDGDYGGLDFGGIDNIFEER